MKARRTVSGKRFVPGKGSDEWTIYALAAPPLPATIDAAGRTVRVLAVGPIGILGVVASAGTTYTEAALRDQHEIVLALSEKVDPLLPVRFGTRMASDNLHETILRSAGTLSAGLDNVRGRRQMTLRLIGSPGTSGTSGVRSGAAYLQQRRVAWSIPGELDPLRTAVNRFVVEERTAPGRAGVRITLFHLVERDAIDAYRKAVEEAAVAMPPGSVTLSGPWPPFAFAPELTA